jgi:aryl-alcohol dehydrogenase-like predicted oxidoreductase
MGYRVLGRTGVRVSPLCLGTISFGAEADEAAAAAMFHRCQEVGVNFFDTADSYNDGRSEEILGKLVAGCREAVVITTKVFFPTGRHVNDRGLSRRHLLRAAEASLQRLRTDRIDLYFVHAFDQSIVIEDLMRALDDLVRHGKILYPAVSNWAAWQIAKALGVSARESRARFECIQPLYNLVKRQAEVELLPLAKAEGLGVMTYNPLGGGLLTGKYGVGTKPASGRLVEKESYVRRYGDPHYYPIAQRLAEHAKNRGVHPAALAVAWVMAHPAVTAPVLGARNVAQLDDLLPALDIPMTAEWRAEISAFSPSPPPYHDRSEEIGDKP